MSSKTFNVIRGGIQDRFFNSRKKIQVYGGGFANGKTSGAVIKALELARAYPGSNGLIARSTYPKLNDTIRKEWLKWCPQTWIKSFPMSANSTNTCTLTNGTTVNFRYIQQQGKKNEGSTSNLLSANYDWIVVDQIEDPEIVEKDFNDLLGRLRGSTAYVGDDKTMPETGPRWFIVTLNPTRNWVYKKLIRPYHAWLADGQMHDGLLVEHEEGPDGLPLLDESGNPIPKRDAQGRVIPIVELFESSTYENRDNLPRDYIKTLEATYTGVMRKRFLLGQWAAYEGLVYPMYDSEVHQVPRYMMIDYLRRLWSHGFECPIIEGYDHGMVSPSCYELAFVDPMGNVILFDGMYKKEQSPAQSIKLIRQIRNAHLGIPMHDHDAHMKMYILADPAVFRRGGTSEKAVVGRTTADIFFDDGQGVAMERANNDIVNGIAKVQSYLSFAEGHHNPFTGEQHEFYAEDGRLLHGAPHLYIARELTWFDEEISDYYWEKNTDGVHVDKPKDGKDHAMDTLKYLLTHRPPVAEIVPQRQVITPAFMRWNEIESSERKKAHRYGN